MKARKKPVEIEAAQASDLIKAAREDWQALPQWIRDAYDAGIVLFLPDSILIKTLEGEMRGEADDWILQGVQREIYPCKPAIFAQTYDLV